MSMRLQYRLLSLMLPLVLGLSPTAGGQAQQLVQRGPFSKPVSVMDEGQQWSIPLLVYADADTELYIPDITAADWLNRNYQSFIDKGQYHISMFTLYKTPRACRANQVQSGYSDADHLNACLVTIRYRLREAAVDLPQQTATLLTAGMLDQDGHLDPASVQHDARTRHFSELDAGTQAALAKTNELVAKQMRIYDLRVKNAQ